MRMLFKQRLFSWFDSYDIYDENGATLYTVKGQLAWGHLLKIYDRMGNEVGCVKQVLFTFMPKFELYKNGNYCGRISREFTFSNLPTTSNAGTGMLKGISWDGIIPFVMQTVVRGQ